MFVSDKAAGEPAPHSPAKQILVRALAILETPGVWTKGNPQVGQECAETALTWAYKSNATVENKDLRLAYATLVGVVRARDGFHDCPGVCHYNDNPYTRYLDILSMYRDAIAVVDSMPASDAMFEFLPPPAANIPAVNYAAIDKALDLLELEFPFKLAAASKVPNIWDEGFSLPWEKPFPLPALDCGVEAMPPAHIIAAVPIAAQLARVT